MFKLLAILCLFLAPLALHPSSASAQSQTKMIGPGKGGLEENHIVGLFAAWDRKATPMLVLRVHGAGMLQTFAEISPAGEFKLALPEVPAGKGFGSLTCGTPGTDGIVVVTDFSLLTNLPGFSSPGKWDRGLSTIGMATFSDAAFSSKIGSPGSRRANWLYSESARDVDAGECNNTNGFHLEPGWNAFTVTSGPSGGPHTYSAGLEDDLGWYWYAFPEDMAETKVSAPAQTSGQDASSEQTAAGGADVTAEWLHGEWSGVQVDVQMQMRLEPSGEVWLESIENGRRKVMEGKWTLADGEFSLTIPEGVLAFNVEMTSENGFRLFGKAASSDLRFTRVD